MPIVSQSPFKMPHTHKPLGVEDEMYDTCQIAHCDKRKHPDVGIPLCVRHLQKAWAAYQTLDDAPSAVAGTHDLADRDVVSPDAVGIVYFVRVGELIKVGWTNDIHKRSLQLNADAILHTQVGTRRDERAVHGMLAADLAEGREWFNATSNVMQFIESLRCQAVA